MRVYQRLVPHTTASQSNTSQRPKGANKICFQRLLAPTPGSEITLARSTAGVYSRARLQSNTQQAHLRSRLLFHRKDALILEKLEAQLKACLCRISFSKAKVGIYGRGQRSPRALEWFRVSGGNLNFSALAPPPARAAVHPGLGAPEARDRGRPAGGHVGDRLSHSETLEGKHTHTRYTTTDTQH